MVAPISEWEFSITFVVHKSKIDAQVHTILDATVSVNIKSYADLINDIKGLGHSNANFDEQVVAVLNKPGVSLPIRTKAHELLT